MPNYICQTCGVQYDASAEPPSHCPICDDERQYLRPEGQRWTTLEDMRGKYRNTFTEVEPNLIRLVTEPHFGIGQFAYLVRTSQGNVLWDCLTHIDDATVDLVNDLGGIAAIAISHPHFYAASVEWSHAFGDAPIYLHGDDAAYVQRHAPSVTHFDGDAVEAVPGVAVVRLGGHFHGSTVLHWPDGADGRGVLLTGDTIALVADRGSVTIMYSYPNRIPLPATTIRQIVERVDRYDFDRIYDAFADAPLSAGAKDAVHRSAERYIGMVEGSWPRR